MTKAYKSLQASYTNLGAESFVHVLPLKHGHTYARKEINADPKELIKCCIKLSQVAMA